MNEVIAISLIIGGSVGVIVIGYIFLFVQIPAVVDDLKKKLREDS